MNTTAVTNCSFSSSVRLDNGTDPINGTSDGNASYGVLPYFSSFFILMGTVPCLYALFHFKDLRTAFNFYVISALLCDLGFLFQNIIKILESYTSYHWLQHKAYCQFFVFLSFLPSIVTNNSHCLISISRFWALYFPHHYRTHHTKKFALIACLIAWVAMFVVVAPILAVDEKYYVEPILVCAPLIEKQLEYYMFMQFYIDIPIAIIIVNYPILLYKYLQRSTVASDANDGHTDVRGKNIVVKPSQRDVHRKQQRRSGFLVLTWVFVCATAFWAPVIVYGFMVALNPATYSSELFAFLYNWSVISNSLEPWMFMLTIHKLRTKLFTFKECH